MPVPLSPASPSRRSAAERCRPLVAIIASAAMLPIGLARPPAFAAVGHLVISEVATGGVSASDELIELYNPTSVALPLEGLELVYVTASGATVSRRASWSLGAPPVPPGGHVLVANELGIFAAVADALYASGMAASGGSVALRIQGASSAIDAIGWGTAASAWLEGTPASAPAAGSSLERLPGGAAGSGTDTDDNASDFTVRAVPDPRNTGSPPVPAPSGSPDPSAAPTSSPTPAPTADPQPTPSPPGPTSEPSPSPTAPPTPSGSPSPNPITVMEARTAPDGTTVTVAATALTDSTFSDGGGYLADGTGGIAVLLDSGSFARGDRVTVTGVIDDRFAQRTLRADAPVTVPGGGESIEPAAVATGAIGESVEGRPVRISGAIDGSGTVLADGVAFNVDDGSGPVRVVVGTSTAIDTAAWTDGRLVVLVGVVGQRDSSGTGTAGYRVQPRDPSDVGLSASPPSPSPSVDPSGPPSHSPSPSPSGGPSISSIAAARAAARNARVTVRGVVTLATDTVEAGSAVIQDASGAILLRLSDDAGSLGLGELVEVDGIRSAKGGMESLRVSDAPRRLGSAPDPQPRPLRTGDAREQVEAQLVAVRGAVVANARRASSGSVSFEVDDGSGPLRVLFGASLAADDDALVRGSWVQIVGVVGQETSGSQPQKGYRIWSRSVSDLTILAAPPDPAGDGDGDGQGRGGGPSESIGSGVATRATLAALNGGPLADLRVGATLVAPASEELGLAGLLWDGRHLVGIAASSEGALATITAERRLPVALDLGHLVTAGVHAALGITLVALGPEPDDVRHSPTRPVPPRAALPGRRDPAAWVSVIGFASGDTLIADRQAAQLEMLCDRAVPRVSGRVSVTGIALSAPTRILVPCGGIRPAPDLALAASTMAVDSGHATPPRPALTAVAAPAERPAAVWLLGVGMLILLLVAGVRLRLGVAPQPTAAESTTTETPVSRLTLVPLPRERGP